MLAWNAVGPEIEPGSDHDKMFDNFSPVSGPPIIFIETPLQIVRVICEKFDAIKVGYLM